jgi:hypothetical protein
MGAVDRRGERLMALESDVLFYFVTVGNFYSLLSQETEKIE